MFTELVNSIWYPINSLSEKSKRKEILSNGTDTKVGAIGRVFCNGMSSQASKGRQRHSLSPFTVLWWASLVVGARAQMTDPFPAQFNLSDLNGFNGFSLSGEQATDWSGVSVSSAGDVNRDGVADILIGAYGASPLGKSIAGKAYVIFGMKGLGRSGGTLELSSLNGTNGFVINGDQDYDHLGISVANAGDVNGDGVEDLLLGAYLASPGGRVQAGRSYVLFGKVGLGSGGILELSSLDGSNGFVLKGDQVQDHCGTSVSRTGDVNGDGIMDLIVGAIQSAPTSINPHPNGLAYIVYGKAGLGSEGSLELASLDGTDGFVLYGEQKGDKAGYSVSFGGDVNEDGISDFLIGAFSAYPPGRIDAGKSYVVFGRNLTEMQTTNTLSKSTISSTIFAPPSLSKVSHTSSKFVTRFPTSPQQPKSTLDSSSSAETNSVRTSVTQEVTQRTHMMSLTQVDKMTSSDEGVGNGLIVGIAVAVAALFCSIVAGGVVGWRKLHNQKHNSKDEVEGTGMTPIKQDTRVYGVFPPRDEASTEYMKPPPPQNNPSEYDRVDGIQPQNEYSMVENPSNQLQYESVFSKLGD